MARIWSNSGPSGTFDGDGVADDLFLDRVEGLGHIGGLGPSEGSAGSQVLTE